MSSEIIKTEDKLKPEDLIFLPKQTEVIQTLASGKSNIFFEGAVRAGKSVVYAYLIDYICSHTFNMQFYVFRDTFESIKNDTHRIFIDIPGFARGKAKLRNNGHELYYPDTHSTIFFKHAKDADLRGNTQGITAGGIYFEQLEAISERDFDIIRPRLSQWGPKAIEDYKRKYRKHIIEGRLLIPRNYLFMSANPRAGWLKSRYIDTHVNLVKEDITRISTSILDNLKNLGPEYENMVRTASDAFKKQYFMGDWTMNSGLIYSEFSSLDIDEVDKDGFAIGGNVVSPEWEIKHKIPEKITSKQLRTVVSIDPGYVKSKFVAIYSAILEDGTIYCFDEVVFNGKSRETWEKIGPEEFGIKMLEKYKEKDFKPDIEYIDPAAHNPQFGMGSVAGQLQKIGISPVGAKKGGEYDAILGIKTLFKNKRILINARCQEFIKELGLFRWDERKVVSGDQKPIDDDNDFCDALRYIYMAQLSAKTFPVSYEEKMKEHYDPNNQYANWMSQWKKKKKSNRNPLDYGV